MGVGAIVFFPSSSAPGDSVSRAVDIVQGPILVWSDYECRLESRDALFIGPKFQGSATVLELVPEGTRVSIGEPLARFDSSELDRRLVQLERDVAVAETDLVSLEKALQPMALHAVRLTVLEAQARLRSEQRYLEVIIPLAEEELVSEQEIDQQLQTVDDAKTELDSAQMRERLTRDYLHPAALKQSQAKLTAATRELEFAREKLSHSVILAPRDGMVVYQPTHFGTEFRTVRVGDTVYLNQPFMTLPDLTNLVAQCSIPEVELARVAEGGEVLIRTLAYPEIQLHGRVQKIAAAAQSDPRSLNWQKFFQLTASIEESDPRLRPGMSATVHVLSYQNPEAVLVPRIAVSWDNGVPSVQMKRGRRVETRQLTLGPANELHYDVLEGLEPGEVVLVE